MSNLGFQTVYRLFNAEDDVVCERVLPAAQAGARRAARVEHAARHARIADAGRRLRRLRVLRVVRVGLRERPDAAAAGRRAALRRRTQRAPSARRHRRRRDVREPRAAGAVCRRHRRRRRRGARAGARPRVQRSDRPRRSAAPAVARARLLHAVVLRAAVRRRRIAGRLHASAPAPTRRCPSSKAAVKTTEALDPPATSIFTPDTEFGSRFLDRSRPRLREPVPLLLGRLQLPARPAVSDRSHSAARPGGAASTRTASAWSRSRSAITRTSSASSRGSSRWATRSAPRRCASTI